MEDSNRNKIENEIHDTEAFRDSVATIDHKGKRIWIYPKKPKGKLYNWRNYVGIVLLIMLFVMPFIKIGGEPLLMLNILERKFVFFGQVFTPQDFHLFGLGMITLVLFIILFTVVYGRLFCGWVCPQTVFMELVFRKIEYWIEGDAPQQRKLNAAPWTREKIIKKILKLSIFFLISVLIANLFLSYIIGVEQVGKIITEPISAHFGGFVAMIIFSFVFFGVFAFMREQVCIAICPYGRLQGVLLTKDSVVVAYDHVRGEPRGKIKKGDPTKIAFPLDVVSPASTPVKSLGDCIDCKLCIAVCPTGIDIRNGTQLECTNCTACIDACDEVMDKVGRPQNLIRYDSLTGIDAQKRNIFTPRVYAYSAVLMLLIVADIFLFSRRTSVEAIILRAPGMLFQKVSDTQISNLYTYQLINKTNRTFPVHLRLKGVEGNIRFASGKEPIMEQGKISEGAFFIDLNTASLKDRKTTLSIEVYDNENKIVDEVETSFYGPVH